MSVIIIQYTILYTIQSVSIASIKLKLFFTHNIGWFCLKVRYPII